MAMNKGFLFRSVTSTSECRGPFLFNVPSNPVVQTVNSTLTVRLLAAWASSYFQCSIRLHVAPDTIFKEIDIKYEPDDYYVRLDAKAPLRASEKITASLFHGLVTFDNAVAPELNLEIGDGSVHLGVMEDTRSGRHPVINVASTSAPVFIESCHPLTIDVPLENSENALFRSDGSVSVYRHVDLISSAHAVADLEPEQRCGTQSVTVNFDPLEAPIYGIAHRKDADLEDIDFLTWAGKKQENPTFTASSLSRIKKLKKWIDQESNGNWIASVHVSGWSLPKGYWRFVSSAAFIECMDLFMLTSAGLLTPDRIELQLHMMGLHCSWDDVHGSSVTDTSALLLQKDDMGLLGKYANHRRLAADNQPAVAPLADKINDLSDFETDSSNAPASKLRLLFG